MHLGFTTVTFRNKSIEDIFNIARDNGMDMLEIGGDIHLPYNDTESLNKVINLQNKYNITAISYGTYYKVGENDLIKFESICRVTQAIGAKIIRVWLGRKSSKFVSKELFSSLIKELQDLCDIANKYNCIVAAEFHLNTLNDNYKSCLSVIKACKRENYKTYWQPLGNLRKDIINLENIKEHIVVVHTFNWKFNRIRCSFKYSTKWKKFMRIILGYNKDIPFIMEFVKGDSEINFRKDVVYIRKMMEKIINELRR